MQRGGFVVQQRSTTSVIRWPLEKTLRQGRSSVGFPGVCREVAPPPFARPWTSCPMPALWIMCCVLD